VHIARYRVLGDRTPRLGVVEDGHVREIASHSSFSTLLGLRLTDLRRLCLSGAQAGTALGDVEILAPVDGNTEVWAAGVTYLRSREARVEESVGFADVYTKVYEADRPELFFKSAAWRVVGSGSPVAVRADSKIDVPEAELALVVNRYAEVIGYTVCNDVSSRSLEGENPLYLPQAKIYLGSCALGPMVRPVWEVADARALTITSTVRRRGEVAWTGQANTSLLRRSTEELVRYLFAADEFPWGVVLSTGTCLVPDLPFTLETGDEVSVAITEVGELVNTVVRGKTDMSWLVEECGV
jgi:2-dehydro-3-deoxy-D-arabinonate dehydratase